MSQETKSQFTDTLDNMVKNRFKREGRDALLAQQFMMDKQKLGSDMRSNIDERNFEHVSNGDENDRYFQAISGEQQIHMIEPQIINDLQPLGIPEGINSRTSLLSNKRAQTASAVSKHQVLLKESGPSQTQLNYVQEMLNIVSQPEPANSPPAELESDAGMALNSEF